MEESESAVSLRLSRCQVSPTDFELIALAGRGAFGKVWVVRKKNDFSGKVMAMKEMNKQDMISRGYVSHTKQEKDIMAKVGDFPLIVDLYFTFHSDVNIYIVMEYVPGGNLLSYVMDTDQPWPEDKCQFYGGEILLALEHIHSKDIVYKDLKLENVLLDMDGHVRLTDFGLSKQLTSDDDRVHSMSGTAAYLAPEVIDSGDEGHGKSADIWAYGVLMFTILLHESPFYSENLSELFDMIVNQDVEWEYYKEDLSPSAFSLLQGLLVKDPIKRLGCGPTGIQEIKEHPFFDGVNWEDLKNLKVKPFIRPKLRVAERATEQDKLDLQSGRVSKQKVDRGEFSDFSFVAADYIQHTATDPTDENISSWSASDDEEEFAWPFISGTLPFSAVNQIVRYLSISDISRASQVCKSWNKFLWSNIHEIDLSTVQPELFDKYWHSHICKVLKRPQRLLKMRMNPACTDDAVAKIPVITPLETLSFKGCMQITNKSIRNLSKESAKAIRPKKLKYPMLAELDLSECSSIDDGALEEIGKILPLLKQLNLANSAAVTDAGLAHLNRLQSLWQLNLHGLKNLTDSGIKQLVDLPNLRVLELTGCVNLTNTGVESLRTKAKQLEVLIWSTDDAVQEDDDIPEKAAKMGLAGFFSKKGSLFKVSRNETSSKTPARLKASKNFLPSFRRKKSKNASTHLNFGHQKKPSLDENAISLSGYNPDEHEEDFLPLSPRSRGAKKREKKKEKAKERKTKREKKDQEGTLDVLTSPRTERPKKDKKTAKVDRIKSEGDGGASRSKIERIKSEGDPSRSKTKLRDKEADAAPQVSPEMKRLNKSIRERHKKRKDSKKSEKNKLNASATTTSDDDISLGVLADPKGDIMDSEKNTAPPSPSHKSGSRDDASISLKTEEPVQQKQQKRRPKSVEIGGEKDFISDTSPRDAPLDSSQKSPKRKSPRVSSGVVTSAESRPFIDMSKLSKEKKNASKKTCQGDLDSSTDVVMPADEFLTVAKEPKPKGRNLSKTVGETVKNEAPEAEPASKGSTPSIDIAKLLSMPVDMASSTTSAEPTATKSETTPKVESRMSEPIPKSVESTISKAEGPEESIESKQETKSKESLVERIAKQYSPQPSPDSDSKGVIDKTPPFTADNNAQGEQPVSKNPLSPIIKPRVTASTALSEGAKPLDDSVDDEKKTVQGKISEESKRSSLVLQRKAVFESIGTAAPVEKPLPSRSPRKTAARTQSAMRETPKKADDPKELLKILGENPAKVKIVKTEDMPAAERSVQSIASLWQTKQ